MTAARYAEILASELPGWTITPHPDRRGVVLMRSPTGAEGLVRPSVGEVGNELQPGFTVWSWKRPEYIGARGARRLAADLLAANGGDVAQ